MKVTPMPFRPDMVRAMLNGHKTMTRRIVKPQPVLLAPEYERWHMDGPKGDKGVFYNWPNGRAPNGMAVDYACPYGRQGDLLWVRENFVDNCRKKGFDLPIYYKADIEPGSEADERRKAAGLEWKRTWFLPKAASRLTLEITGTRIEKLHALTEEDAVMEGCREGWIGPKFVCPLPSGATISSHTFFSPAGKFQILWNDIHGADAWEENPWVWVIRYIVHKQNVKKFLQERAAA